MKGIIGKKLGMTRIFNDQGRAVPVTVIEVGPCPVIQVKTKDSDGYDAIQIGFGKRKEKRTTKPAAGHFAKAGQPATHLLREIRLDDVSGFEVGAQLTAELFKVGERVKVTGFTKGKGFQGVVKRWGFHGGPATHGSKSSREAGSIGQCATPAKVWKNRKMPGHTGNRKKTVSNLEVVQVDLEKNLIAVKGAVPGHANGYVMVTGKA
jgi:large subunit ribosomal protein L3